MGLWLLRCALWYVIEGAQLRLSLSEAIPEIETYAEQKPMQVVKEIETLRSKQTEKQRMISCLLILNHLFM
jgi:hypothetical protein